MPCIVQWDQLDGLGGPTGWSGRGQTGWSGGPCLGGNHLSCNIPSCEGKVGLINILVENDVACLLVYCCGHM